MAEVFRLPGPRRFAAGLASLVREGRSVLVQVPVGQQVPVLAALTMILETEGYPCYSLPEGYAPQEGIAWMLSIEDEITAADPVRSLLAHARLRTSQVFLGEVDATSWPAWQRFLRDFETEVAGWGPFERPRIVLLWSAQKAEQPPGLPTALCVVRTWRGCMGELDLKVHVGSLLLDWEISSVQRKLLTEFVVALSLWDLDLADRLLDLSPRELTDPLPALTAYAQQRGWTRQTPADWTLGTAEDFEGTRQIHSAHAAVSGRTEIIRRRQWEAQASVVLPLVDRLRRELIEDGFGCFRRVWVQVTTPADLYDKDIGALSYALRNGPKDLKQRAEALRWYRNELSHLRPLPFDSLYSYRGWPAS